MSKGELYRLETALAYSEGLLSTERNENRQLKRNVEILRAKLDLAQAQLKGETSWCLSCPWIKRKFCWIPCGAELERQNKG